jgi:DNA-binding NarL/FixJ family response regulator
MAPRPKLTATQEEVLILIGDGLTYPEIAAARGVSESAVEKCVQRQLKPKFGVRRKSELVKLAQRHFIPRLR